MKVVAIAGERTVFLQLKLFKWQSLGKRLYCSSKCLYFNLFMVPQAFQLSSSGQTKFIPAWTCVEEAPLSTKRITRGGEEMAEVRDLSLMLLGKHVWRHFTGLTGRPCWDQPSCSLSNVRGQADSALCMHTGRVIPFWAEMALLLLQVQLVTPTFGYL